MRTSANGNSTVSEVRGRFIWVPSRHGAMPLNQSAASPRSSLSTTGQALPWPSPRRAWYGVAIFGMTVMTLFGSGSLAGLLMQAIKRDLVLTDTQVSLIVGFA